MPRDARSSSTGSTIGSTMLQGTGRIAAKELPSVGKGLGDEIRRGVELRLHVRDGGQEGAAIHAKAGGAVFPEHIRQLIVGCAQRSAQPATTTATA